jgi:putative endopeptidase
MDGEGCEPLCACCSNPYGMILVFSSFLSDSFYILSLDRWNSSSDSKSGGSAPALSVAQLMYCSPCLSDSKGYSGIDPSNFDNSENLKENFYLWSNGGWRARNPIPGEYPSWGTFIALRDLNLDRLKVILEELQGAGGGGGGGGGGEGDLSGEAKKLADFYNSMMDEDGIETRGIAPLAPLFSLIDSDLPLPSIVATLHLHGVKVFFSAYSTPDKSDASRTLLSISQSGLGLPDRDYYFDEDKEQKRLKYIDYIESILSLIQEIVGKDVDLKAMAAGIFEFERKIAEAHMSKTLLRDPEKTFNKMSISKLVELTQQGDFDWESYLQILKVRDFSAHDLNVATVDAISATISLMSSTDKTVLRAYNLYHTVNSFCAHLSKSFVDAQFNFFEKELKGTAEQRQRWKRALEAIEESLGEAMGKLYTSKHFDPTAKTRALVVVEAVRNALRERLSEIEWMSAESKVEAFRKMEGFKVKIGYPNRWIDYSALEICSGKHLENVFASRKFDKELDMTRVNAPTDRERWFMTPQTVNAYFHPSLNEIVFPAAILQPPFFDATADDAVKFGSLGAVVGHEMTHGYDDSVMFIHSALLLTSFV